MIRVKALLSRLEDKGILSACLTLVGALIFGWQLWGYAHTQTSFVDEGMYQYLGYEFVTGGNISYGDLGAWNYYAPLSHYFPGFAQALFGPGLDTGRFFSIFCSLLTCAGLWLLARGLGGKWWATAVVWALALTPMQIKMYSLGLSQALTACLLIWTLVLVVGEKRSLWHILAGSFLAGISVMTRHNLIPLLPLLAGYIFWQQGRKMGFWSVLGCALPVLLGMTLFWPNSLRMWSLYWLPEQWIPALSRIGPPAGTTPVWGTRVSLSAQFSSFFLGLRAHYLALVGAFASLLLWPRNWEDQFKRKTGIFLAALFFSLFLLHAWASLGYNQCTYCFAPYTAFYSNLALLLVVITFSSWVRKPSTPRQITIVIFLLFISLTPAFMDGVGDRLLALPVPRVSNGIKIGEWTTLWSYVSSLLKIEYEVAHIILPTGIFLSSGILFLVIILIFYRLMTRRGKRGHYAYGASALVVFLLAGFLFSSLMNSEYRENGSCDRDIIGNFDQVGAELAALIPAGSQVYWDVDSAVLLLYLPSIDIHPTQVYGIYTYRIGGSANEVEVLGYWNEELARRWMAEADTIVIEGGREAFTPAVGEVINLESYTLKILAPVNPCQANSRLFVYQKSP